MSARDRNTPDGPLRLFNRGGQLVVRSVTAQDSQLAMLWARAILYDVFGETRGEEIVRSLHPMSVLLPYALLLEQGGEN